MSPQKDLGYDHKLNVGGKLEERAEEKTMSGMPTISGKQWNFIYYFRIKPLHDFVFLFCYFCGVFCEMSLLCEEMVELVG